MIAILFWFSSETTEIDHDKIDRREGTPFIKKSIPDCEAASETRKNVLSSAILVFVVFSGSLWFARKTRKCRRHWSTSNTHFCVNKQQVIPKLQRALKSMRTVFKKFIITYKFDFFNMK